MAERPGPNKGQLPAPIGAREGAAGVLAAAADDDNGDSYRDTYLIRWPARRAACKVGGRPPRERARRRPSPTGRGPIQSGAVFVIRRRRPGRSCGRRARRGLISSRGRRRWAAPRSPRAAQFTHWAHALLGLASMPNAHFRPARSWPSLRGRRQWAWRGRAEGRRWRAKSPGPRAGRRSP